MQDELPLFPPSASSLAPHPVVEVFNSQEIQMRLTLALIGLVLAGCQAPTVTILNDQDALQYARMLSENGELWFEEGPGPFTCKSSRPLDGCITSSVVIEGNVIKEVKLKSKEECYDIKIECPTTIDTFAVIKFQ